MDPGNKLRVNYDLIKQWTYCTAIKTDDKSFTTCFYRKKSGYETRSRM